MIRNIVSLLFISFSITLFAQINEADSTVQVISYWDKNEKQTYLFTSTSIKVKNDVDTIENQVISYKVDVEVIDSTENSYTMKWTSYDVETSGVEEKILDDIIKATSNSPLIFKVTELGEFLEILNLEDIKKEYKMAFSLLRESFKNIEDMDDEEFKLLESVFDAIEGSFITDKMIIASATKQINLFHMFYGVRYKLGEEINAEVEQENVLGGDPFNAHMTLLLDDIDVENDLYIMRMWQNVDDKQLTDAVIRFIQNMAKEFGEEPEEGDILNEIPNFVNQIRMATQIHGSTGWPIYSIMTSEVILGNELKIEEMEMEIM